MVRPTTLLFPEDLHVRLREQAAGQGISIGAFVRQAVRRALDPQRALRSRARAKAHGLPRSVDEYLAAPAGTFAGTGARGRPEEAEDPYEGAD